MLMADLECLSPYSSSEKSDSSVSIFFGGRRVMDTFPTFFCGSTFFKLFSLFLIVDLILAIFLSVFFPSKFSKLSSTSISLELISF